MSDIVILGCGLSGMICALSLAKHNISSIIIEEKTLSDKNFHNDIRTTALNSSSIEFLKEVDVWQTIYPYLGPINDIYVADNKAPQMLHFSSSFTPHNQIMGYLIENPIFKKSLYSLLSKNKLIKVLENTKYNDIINTENGCIIKLKDLSISGKILITCDGRSSKAKALFFSDSIKYDYKQKAITFIITHEKNHEGTALEHFMSKGPFAILPLKNEFRSSIVWTVPKDYADALINLPQDEFSYIVQKNIGQFLGKIEIISKVAAFPLRAHAARKYYSKSVVLVADTAHIIHPLAGQGLNQGIKDIECLTRLISKETENPQNIFIEYEKLRQTDNENMLLTTDTINSIFSSSYLYPHAIRQVGFKIIEKITPIKKLLIKYAMGQRKK